MPRKPVELTLQIQRGIKAFIDASGLSVNAWCEKHKDAGIVQSTINRIVTGKMDPSASQVEKIAAAAGVRVDHLYSLGAEDSAGLPPITVRPDVEAGAPPPNPDFSARTVTESQWATLQNIEVLPDRDELVDDIKQRAAKAKAYLKRMGRFPGKVGSGNGNQEGE